MDRIEVMTQGETRTITIRRIMLVAAVVLVLGVIAWRMSSGPSAGGPQNASQAPSAGAASDPLSILEARVRDEPDDGKAWAQLAAAQHDTGRFAEAIAAFGKAIEIDQGNAALWSSRGEARVMASERDPMPAAAVADFRKAISLDPRDPRARYFLGVKRDLDGDHEGAIADWLALLGDTPPGAVWEADLRRTIEQVGKINGVAVADRLAKVRQAPPAASAAVPAAQSAIPGPSAEDIRRSAALRPAEQRAMAQGMVDRLAARLRSDPRNVEGWVMLMRSHMMLNQPDQAARALADALEANPGMADALREQAAKLGIR
jgi:cytochrome c-type biogenesis protein CcmH